MKDYAEDIARIRASIECNNNPRLRELAFKWAKKRWGK